MLEDFPAFHKQTLTQVQHLLLTGCTDRLDDPLVSMAALVPRSLQQFRVNRQHKRLGEEVELPLPIMHLHAGEVAPESILPSHLEGAGEVVHLRRERED